MSVMTANAEAPAITYFETDARWAVASVMSTAVATGRDHAVDHLLHVVLQAVEFGDVATKVTQLGPGMYPVMGQLMNVVGLPVHLRGVAVQVRVSRRVTEVVAKRLSHHGGLTLGGQGETIDVGGGHCLGRSG